MRNDKINCYNLFEKYLVAHIELYGGKGYEYMKKAALLTVGYGDIYPVTVFGKLVSMISSIVGIAVVALPAGVITGDILRRLRRAGNHKMPQY